MIVNPEDSPNFSAKLRELTRLKTSFQASQSPNISVFVIHLSFCYKCRRFHVHVIILNASFHVDKSHMLNFVSDFVLGKNKI